MPRPSYALLANNTIPLLPQADYALLKETCRYYYDGALYCNTIARPFRNMRPPPTAPPFVCHALYTIGDGNIV